MDWGDASDEELDFSQPIIIPRPAASPARATAIASRDAGPPDDTAQSRYNRHDRLLRAMSTSAGMSLEEAQQLGEEGLRQMEFPIGARR